VLAVYAAQYIYRHILLPEYYLIVVVPITILLYIKALYGTQATYACIKIPAVFDEVRCIGSFETTMLSWLD